MTSNVYPELSTLHAIPNGSLRNIVVAKKLKKEGVKKGVPDLHLPVPKGEYASLYIEMKSVAVKPKKHGKGGVSAEQAEWLKRLSNYGNKCVVCYGAKEAQHEIETYLNL